MRQIPLLVLLLISLIFSVGCVYRANISQGNLIKQEDLDQVEIGMTRNQVRFLLGTPMIDDPFHVDRWYAPTTRWFSTTLPVSSAS